MKFRVIPVALLSNGSNVVTSQGFNPWRTVGNLSQHLKLQVSRQADELYIIDINASRSNKKINPRVFNLIHKHCDIPVAVGGGIQNIEDAKLYINLGADKIIITSLFLDNFDEVIKISNSIGFQSISLKLDFKYDHSRSQYRVWDYRRRSFSKIEIDHIINFLLENPVGELVIGDISLDGYMKGVNYEITDLFSKLNTPLVVCCGAGEPSHFVKASKSGKLSGIAGGSIFCFSQNTPCTIKKVLSSNGILVRRPI